MWLRKGTQKKQISQGLLVELLPFTHLWGSWMSRDSLEEKSLAASKTSSYTTIPLEGWGEPKADPTSALARTKPGSFEPFWAVRWYKQQHQTFTIKDSEEFLWDPHFTQLLHRGILQHRAACLGRVTNGISIIYFQSSLCDLYFVKHFEAAALSLTAAWFYFTTVAGEPRRGIHPVELDLIWNPDTVTQWFSFSKKKQLSWQENSTSDFKRQRLFFFLAFCCICYRTRSQDLFIYLCFATEFSNSWLNQSEWLLSFEIFMNQNYCGTGGGPVKWCKG